MVYCSGTSRIISASGSAIDLFMTISYRQADLPVPLPPRINCSDILSGLSILSFTAIQQREPALC
jgi:hypothetical protein